MTAIPTTATPAVPAPLTQALEALRIGDRVGAERLTRQWLDRTGDPRAAGLLGALLTNSGRAEQALPLLEPLAASDMAVRFNLGVTYHHLGHLEKAMRCFESALGEQPDWAEARMNLGAVLLEIGFPNAAVDVLREIFQRPGLTPESFSSLLLALHYVPDASRDEITTLHRRFGEALSALHPAMPPPGPRAPGPLRVGLVSGDLRLHPVGLLIEGLLPALRGCGWWLSAYSSHSPPPGDPVAPRLQAAVDQWVDISRLDDARAAERVRADGIDLLLDLSGHTGYHRLGVFARKPARWQMSWLGYGDTTGLGTMDAVISDAVSSPPGSEAGYTETVLRLPLPRLPFTPPADATAIVPGPSARGEAFTFGCFNNIAKFNHSVLEAWARILKAVPDARLLLKGRQFNNGIVRTTVLEALAARGIGGRRVMLEGYTRSADYYSSFRRVDLALDPFPFNGGVSTLDALWMGVPVLSLEGRIPTGESLWQRQGAMILGDLGLDAWLAADIDDYVAKAVAAAAAPQALHALRETLRERVAHADFSNPERFAKAFVGTVEGYIGVRQTPVAERNDSATLPP